MNVGNMLATQGPILKLSDVVGKIDGDGAVKIVRYGVVSDCEEDITEEIASCYVEEHYDEIDEESLVAPFIEHSDAYEDHLDALEAEALEDSIYGSYEDQNRLRLSDVL
ncbi:MAG: hypothetical protein JSC189_001299 [Candidatus Tokpelaia sp. JSC189]|nr:MAG: hypothetical protein JSC189_001299 [Candidatus Tokpelaia sp. JSC189]